MTSKSRHVWRYIGTNVYEYRSLKNVYYNIVDDVDTWCKLSLGYHATIDVLPIAPFVVSQGLWRGYDPPYKGKILGYL